jgi:trehalose/maltose hydrolase-like predicted phosphorylase
MTEPGLVAGVDIGTTGVKVAWVLQRALETLEVLPPHYRQELADELTIRDEELDRWREISRKMRVVFHADGVLTQFEGYEGLREFDWETARTGTRSPSRPTCSCCCSCCRGTSCASCWPASVTR